MKTEYEARDIDGDNIRSSDSRYLISAGPGLPRPEEGDQLLFLGQSIEIVRAAVISPAGTDVLYDVQGRA